MRRRLPTAVVANRFHGRKSRKVATWSSYSAATGVGSKLKALVGGSAAGKWNLELPPETFDPSWEREGIASFVGADGTREFAVTRAEALDAFEVFLRRRLPHFGPHEDAMLAADPWMAHSLLSAPMNLGLLDPRECAEAAEAEYRAGRAPLPSVEGYIRQLIGWRDYIWNLYWYFGDAYRGNNELDAHAAYRRGSPGWTPTRLRRLVCAMCWLRCVIAAGYTTFRG